MNPSKKTKEQLVKELESIKTQLERFHQLEFKYEKVEKRLKKAKEALEIREWGLNKTNEAVKLLYREIEKKNTELQKLDQLKSDFISVVSHELRTPLAIIKEGLALVLDRVAGDINNKQEKLLSAASENIDRLSRLINDLLDISKIESGKMELDKKAINLVSLADKTVSSLESQAIKKGLKINRKFLNDEIMINADQDKITQLFTNLVKNAIKFTDKGHIEVAIGYNSDGIECSVSDTGKGISENNLSKVFNKFQQFERVDGAGDKGTGLGLSIAKAIVEMHDGHIWVESEYGKGTKFVFIFKEQR